uniref:J domain-containing protein n=1 Tax=Anopheles culicifacies TaxID=139723 RepID=A0A182LZV5_9DIPT
MLKVSHGNAVYKALQSQLHPDANVSNSEKYDKKSFVELLEAYKVLSKPETRAAYDYELSLSKNPGNQVFHSKSFTFKRDQLDQFSRQNAITHAEVREEAEKYGNKAQIERMKAKLNKEGIW